MAIKFYDIKQKYSKLIENFISLNILQIINYIIPLITLPYISRVLGANKFGLVYFALSLAQYFIVLTDFGFNASGVIEISKNREDNTKLSEIFNSIFCIKLLLLLISFILMSLIIFTFERFKQDWLIYYLTFLIVIGNTLFPNWFFQGIEKMKFITILNVIAKLIPLFLIFIFLKSSEDYYYIPILNSLGFIISGIIGLVIAIKKYKIKIEIPKLSHIIKQFKYSVPFFVAQFSNTFSSNSNTFFLGLATSNTLVAYYVAAEKIYQALFNLSGPINLTMTPYMAKNKNLNLYKKVFILTIILTFIVISTIIIFSKPIIITFFGIHMVKAYKMLNLFAILILVIFPSMYIGLPLLGAFNYTKQVNLSTIIGSICHILGLFILYYLNIFNPYSIIIMSIISTSIILLIRIYFIFKYNIFKVERSY